MAAILLADLRFGIGEAVLLAVLFAVQLVMPSPEARWAFIFIYLAISFWLLTFGPPRHRQAFWQLLLARDRQSGPPSAESGDGAGA